MKEYRNIGEESIHRKHQKTEFIVQATATREAGVCTAAILDGIPSLSDNDGLLSSSISARDGAVASETTKGFSIVRKLFCCF